jgi:hypothetical protein
LFSWSHNTPQFNVETKNDPGPAVPWTNAPTGHTNNVEVLLQGNALFRLNRK